jgi:putative beta-lysine N-acetyltransferase
MGDIIQKVGHSTIQHGKENNRIYLMKYNNLDKFKILDTLDEIAEANNYSKIIAKVPKTLRKLFTDNGYKQEAYIPHFYKGIEDYIFIGKYLNEKRKKLSNKSEIKKVLKLSKDKPAISNPPILPDDFNIKVLTIKDTHNMANLYKKVFKTYPFPIFDKEYLKKTMEENITYFGIYKNDNLIAISSSEKDKEYLNCEMTDFATLPEYRGNNFSVILLNKMEKEMEKQSYKLLYTIARAKSYSMNITFSKLGYFYGGTLINNTNIAGNIESMNVWYKKI